MPVFFHLPARHRPDSVRQKAWHENTPVELEAGGKTATAQAWIYQTWAKLRKSGVDAELVEQLPTEGVVVTLNGWLHPEYIAPRALFVAGVVADGRPHPGVDLQIVQNRWHAGRLPGAVFFPHWPQPGIVPRDPARGAKLENVCFFGDPANLAPKIKDKAWQQRLRESTGARFEMRAANRWHDYHDVDVVIAVRGFGKGRQPHKPATKLYNAWLAGVPFIAGSDSAYRTEGIPGTDYLMAKSADHVIELVQNLRDDALLRERLTAEGRHRAETLQPEAMIARWRKFLDLCVEQSERKIRKSAARSAAEYRLKQALFFADSLRHRD